MNYKVILLVFVSLHCFAQKQVAPIKYSGSFPTPLNSGGTADYSYNLDNRGKKQKQGKFKYMLRDKSVISTLNQDCSGDYKDDLKNGQWVYKSNLRDVPQGDVFYTGTVQLIANYKNGIPHGIWYYSSNLKQRRIIEKDDQRIKWSSYGVSELEKFKATFNQGVLVDSFDIESSKIMVSGVMNYKGLMDGEWYFRDGKQMQIHYYDAGYLKKISEQREDSSILLLDKSNEFTSYIYTYDSIRLQSPQKLKDLNYKLDTLSYLAESSKFKTFMKTSILENPYAMVSLFDGDKAGITELSGIFKVVVSNNVTRTENMTISSIETISKSIKTIYNDLQYRLNSEKVVADEISKYMKIIQYYSKLSDRYVCLANEIVASSSFKESTVAAQKKCNGIGQLIDELPIFTNRGEALSYFDADLGKKLTVVRDYEKVVRSYIKN